MAKACVIIGSTSDKDKILPCLQTLEEFGIDTEIFVSSAHRTPERTADIVRQQEEKGAQVFICAAGMAAHLAGAVAARTLRPVIGIPISSQALAGFDSLLSTVQMPAGFPVATVALDKAGAKNADWLAAQILALGDAALAKRLEKARTRMRESVAEASDSLARDLGKK